jgi:hypothetical protein
LAEKRYSPELKFQWSSRKDTPAQYSRCWVGRMCGCLQRLRVLLTPRLQRSGFDLLSSRLHLFGSPEVDVRRRDVAQRSVVPLVVVVIHEPGNPRSRSHG